MFNKKTWTDRESQYPRRRLLTPVEEGDAVLYNVSRSEGTVTQEGDPFNAETMNNLETRIEAEANAIEQALAEPQNGNTATKAFYVNDYLFRNGVFYRVTANIPVGAGFTGSNTVATNIGASLKRLNDLINNTSSSLNGLSNNVNNSINSINNAITGLDNEIDYVDSVRPRGKLVTYGPELRFNNGLANVIVNCEDVFPAGWRASSATITLDGRSDEFLVASLTEADRTRVGVAIHTVMNTSYSGSFTEVGLIIWGNRA